MCELGGGGGSPRYLNTCSNLFLLLVYSTDISTHAVYS